MFIRTQVDFRYPVISLLSIHTRKRQNAIVLYFHGMTYNLMSVFKCVQGLANIRCWFANYKRIMHVFNIKWKHMMPLGNELRSSLARNIPPGRCISTDPIDTVSNLPVILPIVKKLYIQCTSKNQLARIYDWNFNSELAIDLRSLSKESLRKGISRLAWSVFSFQIFWFTPDLSE